MKDNPIMKGIQELNADESVSTKELLKKFEEAYDELDARIEAIKDDLKGDA